MNEFLHYFLLFFIYSIIGWAIETLAIFSKSGKIVNRGFLIGPYCPIYGVGAIAMILYLSQYRDNILTVFLLGSIICSIIEYLTSYFMEKIFKARWWDYSHRRFNLNGRICLLNTILFGLLGILLVYIINPFISSLIAKLPNLLTIIISIICLIIFTIDTIISCKVTKKLQDSFQHIYQEKDNTNEIKESVLKFLSENNKLFQKRILNSFPSIKIPNLNLIKHHKAKK